ncbi:MAG TPA: ABC transporter substrate-binding protein [Mycobacteriales bacterium]|nr:ABC transporter substrate-binding protein [Mycobacteriales bacterium]
MLSKLLALAAATVLLTAGCGSDDSPTVDEPKSGSLASLLPQAIRDKGTLVVGSDIAYPPVESFDTDGKTAIGLDPDLAKAIGDLLGVKLVFRNGTFNGLIPSLTSKRIDLIMSAMSDSKKRQQSVDFVDYFVVGTSIIVKKGNPEGITTLDDLCGKTVAIQQGTTQDDVAEAQKKKCGANKLTILKFPTDPEALLQVKQGRAVADMNDFPVAKDVVQKTGDYEVVGEQIEAGPYGIAVRKADTELRDAIQKAVQTLIDNGTYRRILEKYDVTDGAVTEAKINGGT